MSDDLRNADSTVVEISGTCRRCSLGGRNVVHGTPWCPRQPALGHVDWNGARFDDQGGLTHYLCDWALSRPVAVGERILIYSEWDREHPGTGEMATWAEVVEVLPNGSVYAVEAASEGPWPTITYGKSAGV